MSLETMVVAIEWKASDDDQTLEGYASTFGNVDRQGDVVVKGAFKKTIANIKANGIPLLADHIPSTAHVLGTIFAAEEREGGLWIKARLSKAPSAQDVRTKLLEGHLKKMSIGYEAMDHAYEDRDGQRVRLLKEIKLWETSVVVMPANPQAAISRVKSVVDTLAPDDRQKLVDELASEWRGPELGGGDPAGVREPRRPKPSAGSEGMALRPVMDDYRHQVESESKATVNEIREQIQAAIRKAIPTGDNRYRWIRDFDASHVWFEDDSSAGPGIFEQTYTVSASGAVALTGEPVKVRAVTTYIPVDETGPKNDAAAGEAEAKAAPTAAVADEAAPPSDEDVPGWDRWASEAVLAGRDPEAKADPAKRAGLAKRLELFEEFLTQHDAPVDPTVRAGMSKRLELMEDDLRRSEAASSGARTELADRLASLESPSAAESVPAR